MSRALIATAGIAVGTALATPAPPAAAQGCADVEVVFARGTGEPEGLGRVGQAFVDALGPRLGGLSMNTYAVSYPASLNFLTTAVGAEDAAAHIAKIADRCPGTRMVLGGFSQGAAVIDMLAGVAPLGNGLGLFGSAPALDPDVGRKISAAAVFGNPAARFDSPLSNSGHFAGRAIDVCNPDDPVCSALGTSREAHNSYEFGPYDEQAARFVAALVA